MSCFIHSQDLLGKSKLVIRFYEEAQSNFNSTATAATAAGGTGGGINTKSGGITTAGVSTSSSNSNNYYGEVILEGAALCELLCGRFAVVQTHTLTTGVPATSTTAATVTIDDEPGTKRSHDSGGTTTGGGSGAYNKAGSASGSVISRTGATRNNNNPKKFHPSNAAGKQPQSAATVRLGRVVLRGKKKDNSACVYMQSKGEYK
jgi:hypothetical protein